MDTREHARIDIELLEDVSITVLANISGISRSAIHAAIRNGGRVRRKTKVKLLNAIRKIIVERGY